METMLCERCGEKMGWVSSSHPDGLYYCGNEQCPEPRMILWLWFERPGVKRLWLWLRRTVRGLRWCSRDTATHAGVKVL
jgi:hypothetical protein